MWPADVATRPHHEARENEGLLYASATAVGRDEEKATERWCHDAKVDIRDPSDAGSNDSSTAQRRVYPGNLQLETRSSARLDWCEVTIVSFILLFCTYTMSAPSIASPSRRLSVSYSTIVLLQFLLFFVILYFVELAHNLSDFLYLSLPGNLLLLKHTSAFLSISNNTTATQHLVSCRPTDDLSFRTHNHSHNAFQLRFSKHVLQSWLLSALLRFY
jgi:hypothetical protein